MEIVEISDKGIEGVEGRLVCVGVVEGPVFVQGPIWCGVVVRKLKFLNCQT